MKIHYVIIPAATAVLLSACTVPLVSKTAEQVKNSAEQKAAEQAVLKECKYDQAICQYMVAQMKAFEGGLTMTSHMVVKGKPAAEESVTTMDGKGNFQSMTTKSGKETSNMVVFNKVTYIKDYTDGKWTKISTDSSEDKAGFDVSSAINDWKKEVDGTEVKTVYNKLGQEACGELSCDIYEMYNQGDEANKTKIWIDTKEHLTRKMETPISEDDVNSISYTYGSVTISEPSPVKEMTVPKINPNGQMPSQEEINKMMQELPVETPVE